ncbi:hypothetical protein [Azovibrio restrictus]|uniref:hypothetical protein n=1 Tax=Azovibrio restrictus TaxID=146938 RepID=UPI0026EA59FB|nr:hypothetical protein [Azovibrio restrictus]
MTQPAPHPWQFVRIGGFDQVSLENREDLARLGELDQKLWAALSVPVRGLAIDAASLALIDTDGDGHIRPPELLEALDWAGFRLRDRQVLLHSQPRLALEQIDSATHPDLLSALRHILAGLGRADAREICVADTCEAVARFAAQPLNGDGIVSPASAGEDADLAALITELAAAYPGPPDRNGAAGVDQARLDQFRADLSALLAWQQAARQDPACQPLGADTARAGAALSALAAKVDDYFTRCRLAAFDPRAAALLNGSDEAFRALAGQNLASPPDDMAALPLALVGAGRPLPLEQGINPAWAAAVADFREQVVRPLLGECKELDEGRWQAIKARFAPWTAWQAARPVNPIAGWAAERLEALADGALTRRLEALIAADLALKPEAEAIAAADRITRYVRDLPVLLHNFVAFRDFYSRQTPAAFQAGTLYIDGRSCELTLEVLDPAKHAGMAGLAGIYLLYCDCHRNGQKKTIAAAITAGDADQLIVGRNGVFYDRQGLDWDATVTRIVDHPISLRQAFWSPYKKAAKLIAEQVQKFAAAKSKQADALLAEKATTAPGTPAEAAKPAPFDAAKFAGIFAAIGLALGALGTAVASVITGFLGLKAWQIPLALAGILLLISGPAMAMAWFKLRNRSLAALLDANGWAVNARARINIPFGTALTQLASLPDGAARSHQDPYAEQKSPIGFFFFIGILMALLALYLSGFSGT